MVRRRVTIESLPADLRDALRQDQPQRPINDLCAEILSDRYRIPYASSGKNGRNWDPDSGRLILKLPESVWVEMKKEATPYLTIKQVALQALAEHYGSQKEKR